MTTNIYHPITGDIIRTRGNYAAVLDVDSIIIYEVDPESMIVTDVFDRVLYPNVVFSDLNLRLNSDGTPWAVELWQDDAAAGVHVCKWYHIF